MAEEREYSIGPDDSLAKLLKNKFSEKRQEYVLTHEEWDKYIKLRSPDISIYECWYKGFRVVKERSQ